MNTKAPSPDKILAKYKTRWRLRLFWWAPTCFVAGLYAVDIALTSSLGVGSDYAGLIIVGKSAIFLALVVLLILKRPTIKSIIERRKSIAKYRVEAEIAELQLKKLTREKELMHARLKGDYEALQAQLKIEYEALLGKAVEAAPHNSDGGLQ